jgi:hypothetical protein
MRRIDARTGKVVGRFSVSPLRVANVTNVVADAKQIWLVTGDNDAFRIDPRTKKIVVQLRLPAGGEVSMALSGGSLWIAQAGIRRLTRIDTHANRIGARPLMRVKLADGFSFPHLWDGGDGSLWLQPGPRPRIKLDPHTGAPLKTITLPLKGRTIFGRSTGCRSCPQGIGGVAVGFGSTWVAQWPAGALPSAARRGGMVYRLTP